MQIRTQHSDLPADSAPVTKPSQSYILPLTILIGSLLISVSVLFVGVNLLRISRSGFFSLQSRGDETAAPGKAAGQKVSVEVGHLRAQGKQDAKVKIVAFEDFRCPFCEKFFTATEPQIIKDYVDTGKAVLYYRQYQFLGPASEVAGNAAECANEQGKFWAFHDYLYKNQPQESDTSLYTTDNLSNIAGQLGMNADSFKSCLNANKYDKNVQDDLAAGQAAGVTGTPTVFVNGISIVGAQSYSAFKAVIDQQLSQ